MAINRFLLFCSAAYFSMSYTTERACLTSF